MLQRADILIVLMIFIIVDSDCARMMGMGKGGKNQFLQQINKYIINDKY